MPEMLITRLAATDLIDKEPNGIDVSDLKRLLDAPNVHIKDRATVEHKIRRMVSEGPDKLMVISDFDFTLTKFKDEHGNKFWSSPGVFDHLAKELNPDIATEFKKLCNKYIPIEFNPHMSMEEKIPHMEDFWRESHRLTLDLGFKKDDVEKFVREKCKIALRDGGSEWIERLADHAVPFIIFSAGVGDVIDIYLRHILSRDTLPKNLHLISNMLEYDEEDNAAGFSDPLIHTFCKNSSVIRQEAGFFHQVNSRTNVLLLGDSLGDIHMDVGVENHGPSLKIGFLNHKVDDLIDTFMDIYDIVLVTERSMQIPSAILEAVVRQCE